VWLVAAQIGAGGRLMTALEHNDEDQMKAAMKSLVEKEDRSFKRLVVRLSAIVVRSVSQTRQ
jgi:hypothetical protein